MLLLIFSSSVTNFAEEKYIIANLDLLSKKMPPASAHLNNAQTVLYRIMTSLRRLLTLCVCGARLGRDPIW